MIFINYRRSDSFDVSRRLASILGKEFGPARVFLDESSAKPGDPWPDSIRSALEQAEALLVVIGDKWLRTYDEESGRRRIDLEADWVRQEILTFLDRQEMNSDLLLLPLLARGASMPRAEHLDIKLSRICSVQPMAVPDTGNILDYVAVKQRLIQAGFDPVVPPAVVSPMVGKAPKRLTAVEEREFLAQYPHWRIVESEKPGATGDVMRELYRVYEFTSYEFAWRFMMRVDERAIRPYYHHPRWQNTYNRVEFWLSTFNIGHRPSKKDRRLAQLVESIWGEFETEMFA